MVGIGKTSKHARGCGRWQVSSQAFKLFPYINANFTKSGVPDPEDASETGSVKRRYGQEELRVEAARLKAYTVGAEISPDLLATPQVVSLSYTMHRWLQGWIRARESEMLWIAASDGEYPPTMSMVAASRPAFCASGTHSHLPLLQSSRYFSLGGPTE